MKKIDFLIDSLGGGGAEKVAIELANYLTGNNYKVRLITIKNKVSPYRGMIDKKIEVISLNKKNITNSIFNLFIFYKRNDNDIISFSPAISCLVGLYSVVIRKKTKLYSRCLNTLSEKKKVERVSFKQKILLKLISIFYDKSDIIIAQSLGMKEDLIDTFKIKSEKIKVINNPCNIDFIKIKKDETIEKKNIGLFNNLTIINVGKLENQKNHKFLIKLIFELKKRGQKYNLLILGEGKEKENLKDLVVKLNLKKEVYFLSFQDNPYKYIEKSDFFFLSSYYEGFPNVLLDALACNKVIFSMDCESGPSEILKGKAKKDEIIEGEYGYLMSLENNEDINKNFIDSLIEKLEKKEKNDNYSLKSKERIKKYRKDIILKEYMEVIRNENKKK